MSFKDETEEQESAYVPSSDGAIKKAEEENLKVIFPEENELLLDFDNSVAYDHFENVIHILEEYWGVVSRKESPSLSGKPGHVHVIVRLNTQLTSLERIAIQAALGSDGKRELLGIVRVHHDDPHPTLFLENQ